MEEIAFVSTLCQVGESICERKPNGDIEITSMYAWAPNEHVVTPIIFPNFTS